MRIGFFSSMGGAGSVEVYLKTLMLKCREQGYTPVLFGLGGSWLYHELIKQNIECVAWRAASDSERMEIATCAYERSDSDSTKKNSIVKRLRYACRDLLPVWFKLLAGNAREMLRLVTVFRSHPVDVMHINVHGYEVAGLSCRLLSIPCLGLYQISPGTESSWVRRWLLKVTGRSYHCLVGVSNACMNSWAAFCRVPAKRCRVVFNSVDVKSYHMHDKRGRRSPFRILCVAKLHPMKGIAYLIDAVAALMPMEVELVIAGNGILENSLKQQAKDLGIEKNVVFMGHVSDVIRLYGDADCFVLPSIDFEGCSFALLEAMASGLPCVTSDYAPLAEVNVHERTGLVVPMKNSIALAAAIKRLVRSPDECSKMGNEARKRVEDKFTSEKMVADMIDLYSILCSYELAKKDKYVEFRN